MRILAIDPGPTYSSWALCTFNPTLTGFACGTRDNTFMVDVIDDNRRLLDIVVIERIASYGMPVSETVFETVFWTGRFFQQAKDAGIDRNRITRKAVVQHVCGNWHAKDSNVIQALKDRYGQKGTKKKPGLLYGIKADEWQALAVAVAYAEGVRHVDKGGSHPG